MASFDLCFNSFVLFNEDYNPPQYKIVPDPLLSDPGAHAICGINSHFWASDYAMIADLPQDSRAVPVANFYRVHFWNRWLEQLTSNRLAAMTLDASVNQGAGWACRFLQGATGAVVDGHWGPATIAAANAADPHEAVNRFIELRKQRYEEVGGPSLEAWKKRAEKIPSFT